MGDKLFNFVDRNFGKLLIAYLLLYIAGAAGVVWIIAHFIRKWW